MTGFWRQRGIQGLSGKFQNAIHQYGGLVVQFDSLKQREIGKKGWPLHSKRRNPTTGVGKKLMPQALNHTVEKMRSLLRGVGPTVVFNVLPSVAKNLAVKSCRRKDEPQEMIVRWTHRFQLIFELILYSIRVDEALNISYGIAT